MAIDKFVVGRTYAWASGSSEYDYFVVSDVSEDTLYYRYPNWAYGSDYVHTMPLWGRDLSDVLLVTEEKEEEVHEVKVGQTYSIVGDWTTAENEVVTITMVDDDDDLVHTKPSVYGDKGHDVKRLFFPSFTAFKESGQPLGYILNGGAGEPVVEENNQLSPNVYQFPNGVEVKDISAHLTSFGGQAVQYIARATRLDGVVKGLPVQDLYKAIELLKWEAERMEDLEERK